MTIWPDHRLLDLLGIELPIILAPMAGSGTAALAIAVAEAGGLGSLACALLSPDQARVEFAVIRQGTSRPINMNFFCHAIPTIDAARDEAVIVGVESEGSERLNQAIKIGDDHHQRPDRAWHK
jgi:nitronate monooxygenase